MPPTLLLADDSLTVQRVVSLTFADQAVRVVVAKDGQDAINRMATERPDLVLADTNMPCVDGYELARWVRQQPHLHAVPVLLLAGATDPVDEQRLHDSGANGVLEKPFEPSHVISRVKELLGMKPPPAAAATRLVTSPEIRPAARPVPPPRPAGPGAADTGSAGPGVAGPGVADRPDAPVSAAPALDPPVAAPAPKKPESGIFRTTATVAEVPSAPPLAAQPAPDPPVPTVAQSTTAVADELLGGMGDARDWFAAHEPAPSSSLAGSSSTADVFASLLAAEQGDPAAAVGRTAMPGAELLDRLSAETRAAVAEAVQSAVNESVLASIRGAVNDAIAAALPAAVDEASARVERAVREVVAHEIREIVHDTAERLVSDEIARIRERR